MRVRPGPFVATFVGLAVLAGIIFFSTGSSQPAQAAGANAVGDDPVLVTSPATGASPVAVPQQTDDESRRQAEPVRSEKSSAAVPDVKGRIVDEAGDPIARADVTLWRFPNEADEPAKIATQTTTAAGKYAFSRVAAGTYALTVESTSEFLQRMDRVYDVPQFTVGEKPVSRKVVVKAAGVLAGRVVGPDGAPLAGVSVWPLGLDSRIPDGVTSDADGAYRLTNLAPGTARLAFGDVYNAPEPEGSYHHYECYLNQRPDAVFGSEDLPFDVCDSADKLTVTGSEVTDAQTHEFGGDTATVRTRVVDQDGTPVAGVEVVLDELNQWDDGAFENLVATATTNAQGVAVFGDVALRGTGYQVTAQANDDYTPDPEQGSKGWFLLDDEQTVTKKLTVNFTPAGSVAGAVEVHDSIESTAVSAQRVAGPGHDPDNPVTGYAAVGVDGNYEIDQLPAGTYILWFQYYDQDFNLFYDCYLNQMSDEDFCNNATKFTIDVDQTTQLETQRQVDVPDSEAALSGG